jgi:hypothetical protein
MAVLVELHHLLDLPVPVAVMVVLKGYQVVLVVMVVLLVVARLVVVERPVLVLVAVAVEMEPVAVLVVLHQQAPAAPGVADHLLLVCQDRQETVAAVEAGVRLGPQVETAEQEEVAQGKPRRMEKPEISTETAVEGEVLLLFQVLMLAVAPALQVQ